MKDQDQNTQGSAPLKKEAEINLTVLPSATKRSFVEPEISQPVDVLEATTFFQTVDSGPTN